MGIFPITIIKSKYHFLLALSLGVTIIMSVVLIACNYVIAQTAETIVQQRNQFNKSPQLLLGSHPFSSCITIYCQSIAVYIETNKIYITNPKGGTVSLIDSTSGSAINNIPVGTKPISIAVDDINNRIYVGNQGSNNTVSVIDGYNDRQISSIPIGNHYSGNISIAVDELSNKIYVAKEFSNTVSVIDGNNDTKIGEIAVGMGPTNIAVNHILNKNYEVVRAMIYVVNSGNHSVSVIDGKNDSEIGEIAVGNLPSSIAVNPFSNKIYVVNSADNTVSVINGSNNKKEPNDIAVGNLPSSIAVNHFSNKIYVVNSGSNTVSVINGTNDKKQRNDIAVGEDPANIAVNPVTNMIYVVNRNSSTVSVIDGFSSKVEAGITLNIQPAKSGIIICNNKEYPTNIYLYLDAGTTCRVQPNKDFQFIGWVENLNRNSTIPIGDSSGNLTVNRYGTFTANFKPLPPAIPQEFLFLLVGIILSSLFGWSIPSIAGWVKARRQLKNLAECINDIGKLDKNAIEDKIKGYYVHGKISEDHRQFLKDKISEYYENVKGS